jgi:hypothetical protein
MKKLAVHAMHGDVRDRYVPSAFRLTDVACLLFLPLSLTYTVLLPGRQLMYLYLPLLYA